MDKKKTLIIGLTGNMLSDQRMQRIALALTELGWHVLVYYRDFFKFNPGKIMDTPIFTFNTIAMKIPFNSGVPFYLWYNLKLFLILLFKKSDYYYAVDSDTLPCFIILSKLKRIPLVYDAHEYFAEVPELGSYKLKKKIWHLVTQIGVQEAAFCITVGPILADVLEKRYGKPFISVRNVPSVEDSIITPGNQSNIILYQGALNKGRMLEVLIDGMKHLPEFHCMIAGEGDLSAELRKQSKDILNIEFLGMLSPSELKGFTPKCYAGFNLLDASDSLSYYYSLSNKYFDYMHAGVPSISSKLPEYMNLNDELQCGVCIDNEVSDFVNIIKEWKNNPDTYSKLKENAKFAAVSQNWELEKTIFSNFLKP